MNKTNIITNDLDMEAEEILFLKKKQDENKGFSVDEFKKLLNLTDGQISLIEQQLKAIKFRTCYTSPNQGNGLLVLKEVANQFGIDIY